MRYVLALWLAPLVLFWGWFFLSINDMNFGYVIMTRQFNLAIFEIYGEVLGIDPATIPWMMAKAFALDTAILLAIWAFRRRKLIAEKVRGLRQRYRSAESAPSV
ncbi:DUF6105 family protein [Aminobacter sp. HY435]|uniref:DUF6105 family protein n=1 Tax=Aminobacter sp. HY435 TaxID=2970917 RepID=UPI0022B9C62C|nr:DUF6105 family protein [Aminobacter sp. HY435]